MRYNRKRRIGKYVGGAPNVSWFYFTLETEEYHYKLMVWCTFLRSYSSFEKFREICYTFLKVYTVAFVLPSNICVYISLRVANRHKFILFIFLFYFKLSTWITSKTKQWYYKSAKTFLTYKHSICIWSRPSSSATMKYSTFSTVGVYFPNKVQSCSWHLRHYISGIC